MNVAAPTPPAKPSRARAYQTSVVAGVLHAGPARAQKDPIDIPPDRSTNKCVGDGRRTDRENIHRLRHGRVAAGEPFRCWGCYRRGSWSQYDHEGERQALADLVDIAARNKGDVSGGDYHHGCHEHRRRSLQITQ